MTAEREGAGEFTVVIPFFNEEAFIAATLHSVAAQTEPPGRIILVDNGSTDGTCGVIEEIRASCPEIPFTILSETTPGKIAALECGLSEVATEFVSLCDADTFYPPEYLARARGLLQASENTVAALALGVYDGANPFLARLVRWKGRAASLLMPDQAHTGGYGQSFRMSAVRECGGYSRSIWPYMVADHEIIHRMQKQGALAYSVDHYCITSPRRRDRRRVDWSLDERLAYHLTPKSKRDRFFYDFLAKRFEARGLYNGNLRTRDWTTPGK